MQTLFILGSSFAMFKWLHRSPDDILCPVSAIYGGFTETIGKVCQIIFIFPSWIGVSFVYICMCLGLFDDVSIVIFFIFMNDLFLSVKL